MDPYLPPEVGTHLVTSKTQTLRRNLAFFQPSVSYHTLNGERILLKRRTRLPYIHANLRGQLGQQGNDWPSNEACIGSLHASSKHRTAS